MKVTLISYDSTYYKIQEIKDLSNLSEVKMGEKNTWIDIVGLENNKSIDEIGSLFGLHDLVLEEIFQEEGRSKYENFNDYVYMDISTSNLDLEELKEIEKVNVSFIIYNKLILTFRKEDSKEIERIKKKLKISEDNKLDYSSYLVYLIIQAILDKYYLVIEEIGVYVDELEDQLLNSPNQAILHSIYELKRNLILIRKSLWSIKNVINSISLNDTVLLDTRSNYYIKSVFNDVIHIIDLVETYREISSGMLDTYLSSIGNRTNDVMKTLTLVSTIFTPISFYSGLYMMKMKGPHSYVIFVSLSFITFIFMFKYFKNKKWI